ncbi:lysophospholipid acyltransferase family protein [Solimonas sp. K1W22B-7]|uniref:lysophospholipid acyltransferase family protein n=1 Tax=Solimonas sp. K1W22B-7 TaxID=2303331 RepID=UPI0013C3F3DE|nr:lysophospholipid acyltransferase family protein [Solimonas sp. K1W22B-7]
MIKFLVLRLVYGLVRLLASTYRFRLVGAAPDRGPLGRDGYVLAIWHQNLFAGILAQTGHRHTVIVSRSRDGDPVSYLCGRLGHHVVRGSSKKRGVDKGGKEAKDEMIEALRSGLPGAVTVDGPNGPAHEVKPGIVEMARLAGIPVIPYLAFPQRYWSFRSWDSFRLPKPFSRIDVCYGAPQQVPADTPFEQFGQHQQAIADALQVLEAERVANAAATAGVRRFSWLSSPSR